MAPCSWMPEESEEESCEHQDNTNIHCQPFPESTFEEHEICTDYDGYHHHHVKRDSYASAHFSGNRHFEFSIKCSANPADSTGTRFLSGTSRTGFRWPVSRHIASIPLSFQAIVLTLLHPSPFLVLFASALAASSRFSHVSPAKLPSSDYICVSKLCDLDGCAAAPDLTRNQ
jgi:hypothetical protein